jgi:hypothetical protein
MTYDLWNVLNHLKEKNNHPIVYINPVLILLYLTEIFHYAHSLRN